MIMTALAVVLGGAPAASAELLQLRAEIHSGGAGGTGLGGARQDDAFHAGTSGLAYGATVGAEVLFFDGWVEHNQYLDADGLSGTWTQFMLGLDTELDLGEPTRGKGKERYSPVYGELGFAIGFGVGTGQQVDPPLDNSEVTDKGFLGQVHLGLGYRLNRVLSVGLTLPVQAGYLFKSGDGLAANDTGTQYYSVQGAALVNVRLSLTLR